MVFPLLLPLNTVISGTVATTDCVKRTCLCLNGPPLDKFDPVLFVRTWIKAGHCLSSSLDIIKKMIFLNPLNCKRPAVHKLCSNTKSVLVCVVWDRELIVLCGFCCRALLLCGCLYCYNSVCKACSHVDFLSCHSWKLVYYILNHNIQVFICFSWSGPKEKNSFLYVWK